MPISKSEYDWEERRLEDTLKIIKKKISTLGGELIAQEEKALEFKKFLVKDVLSEHQEWRTFFFHLRPLLFKIPLFISLFFK